MSLEDEALKAAEQHPEAATLLRALVQELNLLQNAWRQGWEDGWKTGYNEGYSHGQANGDYQ